MSYLLQQSRGLQKNIIKSCMKMENIYMHSNECTSTVRITLLATSDNSAKILSFINTFKYSSVLTNKSFIRR